MERSEAMRVPVANLWLLYNLVTDEGIVLLEPDGRVGVLNATFFVLNDSVTL